MWCSEHTNRCDEVRSKAIPAPGLGGSGGGAVGAGSDGGGRGSLAGLLVAPEGRGVLGALFRFRV